MTNNNIKFNVLFIILILTIVFIIYIQNSAKACSTFCIFRDNCLIVGRNYDWSFAKGYIMVNKKNQKKKAFRYWEESSSNLATWTSKYGSITFNQYGMDNAFSGMNEAGLVVSELWLEQTQYPVADSRVSMSVDQYVQYILDNFSSVDEIVATDSQVRLRPTTDNFTKIHFIVIDHTGKGITIEFINGKMVYYLGNNMPVKAITNDTYESSLTYFNRGIAPRASDNSSLARFYRSAIMANDFNPASSGPVVDYAFNVLSKVSQGSWTRFSIVFDIKNMKIYFKSLANSNLKYFDFNSFDFSCQTGSKALDINTSSTGDVTSLFINYTTQINEQLITEAWADLGYTNVYRPALTLISEYPKTFECTITSITNFSFDNVFKIFPNPTKGVFTISFGSIVTQDTSVEIYSIEGRLILKNSFRNTENTFFDLSDKPKGIYLVKIQVSQMIYFQKICLE
jgi:penicillin V acylase-like amidase (Ntn superfamily)